MKPVNSIKKILSLLFTVFCLISAQGQDHKSNQFNFFFGAHYNGSDTEWMPTTGIGVFAEPSILVNNRFKLGYRFEPTALAYGVLVLPGGCGGECKEGANYVLGNYLKAEYMLGKPKIGAKGERYRGYAGLSFNIVTHKRWIITSRSPGKWADTHKWIADAGMGFRIGALLGRFDISASYNLAGSDFRNFFGFGLGYSILNK